MGIVDTVRTWSSALQWEEDEFGRADAKVGDGLWIVAEWRWLQAPHGVEECAGSYVWRVHTEEAGYRRHAHTWGVPDDAVWANGVPDGDTVFSAVVALSEDPDPAATARAAVARLAGRAAGKARHET